MSTGAEVHDLHRPRPPFVAPSSYAAFIRGESFAAKGDYAQAVAHYDQALASAEPEAYLLSRYAYALGRSGDAELADELLREAEARDPQATLPAMTRGELALVAGDIRAAVAAYDQARKRDPNDGQLGLKLAELLANSGAEERAVALWHRLAQDHPEISEVALRAQLQVALQQNDQAAVRAALDALQTHDQFEPSFIIPLAKQLLTQQRNAVATALLASLPVTQATAPLQLQAALALHQMDTARNLLLRYPDEWFGGPLATAEALLTVGEPARALDRAETALTLASAREGSGPLAEQARLLMAAAHLQLQQPQLALNVLLPDDLHGPAQSQARALVANALQRSGMGAFAAEFRDAAATEPTTPTTATP